MSALIPLTRGQFATVDDHWVDCLTQYRWMCTGSGYAIARIGNHSVYMHRLIANTPKGLVADHINRNRLDNQEHNLRNVTQAENNQNRGPRLVSRFYVPRIPGGVIERAIKPVNTWRKVSKFPTFSISRNADKMPKLEELLELYRRNNHTTSRSEVFWDGIDALYAIKCATKNTKEPAKAQE